MTREEAIKYAEDKFSKGLYRLDLGYLNRGLYQITAREVDFLRVAISALREQGERNPCKWCEDMDTVYDIVCYLPHDNGNATDIPLRFCPMCGRRLEEV